LLLDSGRGGNVSSVDAQLIAIDDCVDLASDWRALEAMSDGSPFTAWPWISVWLGHLPPYIRPYVFRASDAAGLVALALLVDAPKRALRRLFGVRSLLLQETGVSDIDEITIEYTGLLMRRGSERSAYSALFETLLRTPQWQSLRISASAHAQPVMAALPNEMRAFSVSEQPSYLTDLAAIRDGGGDYLAALRKSTRSGLRRTRRAYEAHGEIKVEVARDPRQALDWLKELRTLHQSYWHGKGKRGSFDSAYFTEFHEDLVRTTSADGFTDLVRVSAGPLIVGYLYNIRWGNRIYVYNTGLNYGALAREDRPGYLAHLVAIEKYLHEGIDTYDFLAGDADYKRMMSTHVRTLSWIHIKRANWRIACERALAQLLGRRRISKPIVTPTSSDPVPARE
jgi:CelD/BcsL family acetyltransferase involved in cellulose biosynthesis